MFERNKDITSYTTFGIPVQASLFAEYSSIDELRRIFHSPEFKDNEVLHIGGGSNLLFLTDFKGLVLHSAIKGIKSYQKDSDTVYAWAGAGEKWTDLVEWCVSNGLGGLENMAGIPGEVGASAVQNVGAYGVEAKDVIHTVRCFDTLTGEVVTLKNKDCGFAYRDSRFKHEWKGRYYVLEVSFRLHPSSEARNLEYGPLKELSEKIGHHPSIKEVAHEIVKIRDSKLPDPAHIGSAGSFFKNPVVGKYFYKEQMLGFCPDIPSYPVYDSEGKEDPHHVKVSAAWLIDHAGLKGMRIGGAEVYPKQCLVIANAGGATAKDVTRLARHIVDRVKDTFGVILEPEVNFIDTDLHVTILGSGTSKGVPEVACGCRVCRSESHFDKRLRASALVRTHGLTILIDVSPDFREQALRENLVGIDAILLTHSHYDHVGGIDDLRPLNATRNLPIYLRKDVNDDLHRRLDYCFRPHPYPGVPVFEMHEIKNEPFLIDGLKVVPIEVMHARLPIFGYRINNFAYITDAKTIAEEELEKLTGVDTLVINTLRRREHFSHLSLDEALAIIDCIKPRETFLTHISHELGLHEEVEKSLPENVHLCYDGLSFTVPGRAVEH